MHYSQLNSSKSSELLADSSVNPQGGLNLSRPHKDKFEEVFLSDKLDLVFVLDTSPGMENFYQKNVFGADFLSLFQNYDWRMAYTDMSVDTRMFAEDDKDSEEESEEEEEEESCGFLSGVFMAASGFFISQPFVVGMGLHKLSGCFSSSGKEEQKEEIPVFTNGSFLPFEYNGEKLESRGFSYLNQSVPSYNSIFDHSFRRGTAESRSNSFESPVLRKSPAYPFMSMVFSMAKGNLSPTASHDSSNVSFFRKDSLIVYVLITVQDMKATISTELFKKNISSFFGSAERVKVIPITLSENSLFCNINFQANNSDSLKIKKLAVEMGSTPLDICSKNLPEELFKQISQSLYSKDFLSE